jgi:hypothetical protein
MSRTLIRHVLVAALLVTVSSLVATVAHAVPRYSARYEQNCMLCHVNPTGGGMRSEYAVQELIPKELAMSAHRPAAFTALESHLNKAVRIGADFRHQFMLEDEDSPQAGVQGFFPMQGDVHLSFQLDEKYLLYVRRGLSNTYDLWALAHVLPYDGYVKAGRFTPPYGWHFDDHTAYVRSDLGFAPPANTDAGLELGLAPKRGDLQVAITNGNLGGVLDNDRRLAVSASGGVRFKVGPAAAYVGASGYAHPGATSDLDMAGAYGSLAWGPFTWVGEGDFVRRDPATGPAQRSAVASHELGWLVKQGVEIVGTYDWYDPDRDLASGSRSRWGLGARVLPQPFLETQLLVRHTDVKAGRAIAGSSWDEAVVQFHFMF